MKHDRLLRAGGYTAAAALLAEAARQVLSTRPLAADALAAFAADLVASRASGAGRAWYAGDGAAGHSSTATKALARGAAMGGGVVAAACLLGVVLGKARFFGVSLAWDVLLLGLVSAIATAVRVEIPARILPMSLGKGLAPRGAVMAFAVLAGAAPVLAEAPFRPGAVALSVGVGALSVALLELGERPLTVVAAHAAIRFAAGPLFTTTIDLRWSSGSLSPFDRASSLAAWMVAAACIVLAIALTLRARRRSTDDAAVTAPEKQP